MTIWILAILFLASLAGLGYRQGAIRVGFSLIGILLGALLSVPLGHLLKPVISAMGVKNPALLWLVPPCIVFAIILTLVKIVGLMMHKKIEVYFKYKAGDLRLVLWERLNQRLGLCLGTLNATAYIILISLLVYMISYWTVQASTESDPKSIRLVNRMGKDLQSTGMNKVVGAVDQTSKSYYDTADIAGLLYQTPLLEARLSRYPGILGLAEQPEFQDLASDAEFSNIRQTRAPINEVLNYPKVQAILNNSELLKTIKTAIVPNLKDLRTFLETGESSTFTEKILGRWDFDLNGSLGLFRLEKPNASARQLAQQRGFLAGLFGKSTFVATPEHQAFLKNFPSLKATPVTLQTLTGEWKGQDGKYELTFTIDGKPEQLTAELQGSRLAITSPGIAGLSFSTED